MSDELKQTEVIEELMKLMTSYEIDELTIDGINIVKSRHNKTIPIKEASAPVEVDDDLFVLEQPKYKAI